MALPQSAAQAKRIAWLNALWSDLTQGGALANGVRQPTEDGARRVCERIRSEARGLGKGKGWQGACGWFDAHDSADTKDTIWLAIQSLIWFDREA